MITALHEAHSLWWNFGGYGRQDVHLHPCTGVHRCAMALVGPGRDCDGTRDRHHWRDLVGGEGIWSAAGAEGTPW